MEAKQIKAFIDAMASSDLTELEASKDGWTLKLVGRAADAVGGPRFDRRLAILPAPTDQAEHPGDSRCTG